MSASGKGGKPAATNNGEITKSYIDRTRATTSMANSLDELHSGLTCLICNELMMNPTTLSCSHSFCLACISNQKAWTCVFPGCSVPVTVRGQKSYRVNPQLSSVVASLDVIRRTINSAMPKWWLSSSYNEAMSQHFGSPNRTFAYGNNVESDDEDSTRVVSFDLKPQEGKAAEDSDATTLNGDNDECFLSPILKRRKRRGETQTEELKSVLVDVGKTSSKPSPQHGDILSIVAQEKQAPIEPDDASSVATQPYEVSKASTKIANGTELDIDNEENESHNDEEGMFSDNHTPTDLNKSCSLPDISFHVSPIAINSQSQHISPRVDRIGGLKDITEEVDESDFDGTTEEIDSESQNHKAVCSDGEKAKFFPVDTTEEPANANTQQSPKTSPKHCQPNSIDTDVCSHAEKAEFAPVDTTEEPAKANKEQSPKTSLKQCQPNAIDSRVIEVGAKEADLKSPVKKRNEPIPQVFLISSGSSLSASDQRTIRKLLKNDRLQMLQPANQKAELDFAFNFESEEEADSFIQSMYTKDSSMHFPIEYSYALCSNAEYQTCEGYIMPRSFRYILAVACGLNIIDFSYLRNAPSASFGIHDSRKFLYAPGSMKNDDMPTTSSSGRRQRSRGKDEIESEAVYQVAGDVDSTELMGPQRSRTVLLQRLCNLDDNNYWYSNGLLDTSTVFLFGNFDEPPVPAKDNTVGQKRKRSRSKNDDANLLLDAPDGKYTKGRIEILLRLCGAKVHTLSATSKGSDIKNLDRVIVLTRNKTKSNVVKSIKNLLKDSGFTDDTISKTPIVSCKWLEDSIAEFKVKNTEGY